MSADVDRTPPAEILELARLAISTELHEVGLLHQGLGADFPAHIGWQLSLTRIDPIILIDRAMTEQGLNDRDDELDFDAPVDPEREAKMRKIRAAVHEDNHLTVTAQIGSEVDAFRGMDEPYWGPEQIREWILAEQQGVITPSAKAAAQAASDADWAVDAWSRGWSVTCKVDHGSGLSMARVMGRELIEDDLYVRFEFSALNHFFNVEGHPENRGNGTEVSYDINLMRAGLVGQWIYCADGFDHTKHRPIDLSVTDAEQTIAAAPPWHTEVAYFDEDLEEWVL